jgi:excisionase family DNA binding protein
MRDNQMLDIKELAGQLGLHTESLYRMVRKNLVPHVRVGKRIYFHHNIIKDFRT